MIWWPLKIVQVMVLAFVACMTGTQKTAEQWFCDSFREERAKGKGDE